MFFYIPRLGLFIALNAWNTRLWLYSLSFRILIHPPQWFYHMIKQCFLVILVVAETYLFNLLQFHWKELLPEETSLMNFSSRTYPTSVTAQILFLCVYLCICIYLPPLLSPQRTLSFNYSASIYWRLSVSDNISGTIEFPLQRMIHKYQTSIMVWSLSLLTPSLILFFTDSTIN